MNTIRILLLLAATLSLLAFRATAQTTAFTYQGRLTDNAVAANGNYDLRFTLYSVAAGGTGLGSPVTVNPATVTNGLFNATLDFGAGALPGADRWLEIALRPAGSAAAYTALTPRQKLTSAPYATRAATATALSGNLSASQISGGTLSPAVVGDGTLPAAKLSADSIAAAQIAAGAVTSSELGTGSVTAAKLDPLIGLWNKSGTTINYTAGSVGIGSANPQGGLLDVEGDMRLNDNDFFLRGNTDESHGLGWYGGSKLFGTASPDGPVLYGWNGGGLGVANPDTMIMTWDWQGSVSVGNAGQAGSLSVTTGAGTVAIRNDSGLVPVIEATGGGLPGIMRLRNSLEVWPNTAGTAGGRVDVRAINGSSTIILDGESGQVTVKTLNITGGSDLAEPFHMSEADIGPGTVVIIDEDNPGKLKLSTGAYDTRVAGIVSGANGIEAGISLQQHGALEGGQKVALTGRAYALADATTPIKPGDLLTTSDIPGHVMKVTDHTRSPGAVIGKAMSPLLSGRGMVLVLVNLQ